MSVYNFEDDGVVDLIKNAVRLGLIHYIDLTTLFIETPSKAACVYIIQNFRIDTQEVKNLLDDETDDELLWKLKLIDDHEIQLFST